MLTLSSTTARVINATIFDELQNGKSNTVIFAGDAGQTSPASIFLSLTGTMGGAEEPSSMRGRARCRGPTSVAAI